MWSRQYQPLPANLRGLSAPTGRNKSNFNMWSKSVQTLARWKSRKCIGLGWNLHRLFIWACSLHHKDAKLTTFSERSWMKVDYRLRLKRNGTLHWTGIVFHPFPWRCPHQHHQPVHDALGAFVFNDVSSSRRGLLWSTGGAEAESHSRSWHSYDPTASDHKNI